MSVLESHDKVLKEPPSFVGDVELGDSSVSLAVGSHFTPEDYWGVFFDINEQVKVALDDNQITTPFPQRNVNLIKA